MDRHIRITAWIAVAFAVSGAFLLFPIGTPALNFLFVIVKICMVAGLLTFLYTGNRKSGFTVWAIASLFAVLMTILKWSMNGTAVFLYIVSILADIGFPILLYAVYKKYNR
jgi:hypothetical protein